MDNKATLTPEQEAAFSHNYVAPQIVVEEKPALSPAERQAVESQRVATAELMVLKAALTETTASRGWNYVVKFAETVVRELEKEALAEDDDVKANGLRRDARGARKFKDELLRRIDLAKNQDPSTFIEVSTD